MEVNYSCIIKYGCIKINHLYITRHTSDWCCLPYHAHPKGCPNFGKADKCPPKVFFITDVLAIDRPVYFVFVVFDLIGHIAKMKLLHPSWSERQCRCVLYWQNKVRKQLKVYLPF